MGTYRAPSSRAQRSDPDATDSRGLDCFVALLLAMTAMSHGLRYYARSATRAPRAGACEESGEMAFSHAARRSAACAAKVPLAASAARDLAENSAMSAG